MKRIFGKLRARRGETLVEILVAVLILSLAAGVFASLYSASMSIDRAAQERDKAFYDAVESLEGKLKKGAAGGATDTDEVKIDFGSGTAAGTVEVEVFTEGGMKVYVRKGGTAG